MVLLKRVHAQLLNPARKSVVANGTVTLQFIPTAQSHRLPEVQAIIDFDDDRADLVGKPLLLRFNDHVSGLINLHFHKDTQPIFSLLKRLHVDWIGTRWDDLRWFEEV